MNDIKAQCLSRWKYKDTKIENFDNKFDDWISQFSEDFKPICYKLLERFDYYTNSEVNGIIEDIYNSLVLSENLNSEETIYGIIENDENRIGSSAVYLTILANINNIDAKHVFNNSFPREIENGIKNIVLIDDFCGSGDTVIKFMENKIDKLISYNIYIIFIHVMQNGEKSIKEFAKENKINLKSLKYKSSNKIFETDLFSLETIEETKQITEKETESKKINKNIFGYKDSQSLVSFFGNTPNNTLAIFWKDTENYNSIFPRKERKRKPKISELSDEKKERGKQNLNNKIMVKRDG